MSNKSQQLQIRVTPEQKTALKRRARRAGQDMSTYVLSRVLPHAEQRFDEILRALGAEPSHRFPLAELSDFLSKLAPAELEDELTEPDLDDLSPLVRSYVAAMVEVAAGRKGVAAPAWTARIGGLDQPHFATGLKSLRLHLLKSSPVPFKRRNLFVDASVGDRV